MSSFRFIRPAHVALASALIGSPITLPGSAPLVAQQAPVEGAHPIDSLRLEVKAAVERGMWPQLDAAIEALRALALADAENQVVQYELGYALHRRASALVRTARGEMARPLLEEADRALARAISLGGGGGAVALRALVTNQRAAVSGTLEAMRLEPRSYRQLDTALALAPQDPRVALLNGMTRLRAPRAFDGGAEKAEREFRRAISLFEADTTKPPAPTWGHVDAWIWLGIALAELERHEEARAAFEKALALAPGHAWVTSTLLPRLEATVSREP